MLPLAHVILHIGFCRAIERLPESAQVAARVRLTDRIGRTRFNRVYRFDRGDESETIVEFDSQFGIFRLDVAAPQYGCAAASYLFFIPGHDRSVDIALGDTPVARAGMPTLLSGTAPQSFLYVEPTFVLFDKAATACNKPVPTPLAEQITVENDQDAYYAWLQPPALAPAGPLQLALRLRTPTHQYHYVRVPLQFPMPWGGWPESIQFNVTEDMIDALAGDPVDTLLCPKLWRTSVG